MDGVRADALREVEAEAGQDLGLLGIGAADAAQLEFTAIDERQDDVAALDARERVEDPAGTAIQGACAVRGAGTQSSIGPPVMAFGPGQTLAIATMPEARPAEPHWRVD